jgi:glycosyltransferase involved in cell wall biosynthesis
MISISIPAYNYAHYLPVAIESCLTQDEDFELVVIDNCSSDHTPELRAKYEADPRVKWHRNATVLPIQANWNEAVQRTSRPYVKLLQADDLLLPGGIALLNRWRSAAPHLGIHGHLSEEVDENGEFLRRQCAFGGASDYFEVHGSEAVRQKLRLVARFREPTSNFFSRTAWEAVGGYSSRYRFVFDTHFNVKMASAFGGRLWSGYATARRRHTASDGARLSAELGLAELKLFLDEMLEMLGDARTREDEIWATGCLQYRLLELFAQRGRRTPLEAVALAAKFQKLLFQPRSWMIAARLTMRRIARGEVQGQPNKAWVKSI